MTQDSNPLRAEILNEANRQREEILRSAQEAAAGLMDRAEREARQASDAQLKAATAEANRRREAILSTVAVEAKRLMLNRTEEVLNALHDSVRKQLREGKESDRRQALIELAAQALTGMHGNNFVLRLSPADADELSQTLLDAIPRRAGRLEVKLELTRDPEVRDGDWILQDDEERQQWKVGLEARLERLWPDLRRQIATQLGLGDDKQAKPEDV
jgi:vacuolar-type H+-ATPase subunit E/Vma4